MRLIRRTSSAKVQVLPTTDWRENEKDFHSFFPLNNLMHTSNTILHLSLSKFLLFIPNYQIQREIPKNTTCELLECNTRGSFRLIIIGK